MSAEGITGIRAVAFFLVGGFATGYATGTASEPGSYRVPVASEDSAVCEPGYAVAAIERDAHGVLFLECQK